jgi:hypothetical protein
LAYSCRYQVKDAHNIAPAKIDGAIGIESYDLPLRIRVKISTKAAVMANPKRNWARSILVGAITNKARIVISFTSPNPKPANIESTVPKTRAMSADVK